MLCHPVMVPLLLVMSLGLSFGTGYASKQEAGSHREDRRILRLASEDGPRSLHHSVSSLDHYGDDPLVSLVSLIEKEEKEQPLTGGFLDPEDYEFLEHNNATGKTSGCQERDIVLTGRPKFNNIGPVQCAFQCVNTKECVYFVHTELGCSLRSYKPSGVLVGFPSTIGVGMEYFLFKTNFDDQCRNIKGQVILVGRTVKIVGGGSADCQVSCQRDSACISWTWFGQKSSNNSEVCAHHYDEHQEKLRVKADTYAASGPRHCYEGGNSSPTTTTMATPTSRPTSTPTSTPTTTTTTAPFQPNSGPSLSPYCEGDPLELAKEVNVTNACNGYTELTDSWRKIGEPVKSHPKYQCDDGLDWSGWHRFTGAAGTQLPKSYQGNTYHNYVCGTAVIPRMCGSHPDVGMAARRKICWEHADSKCYEHPSKTLGSYIDVAGCRDQSGDVFYVYRLANPNWCQLAYCAV